MAEAAEDSQTDKFDHDSEGACDQQASTSKASHHNPELVSYNTQDLKVLQYNSADDVRQSLKEIIGKTVEIPDQESIPCKMNAKGGGDIKLSKIKSKNYKNASSSRGRKQTKSAYRKSGPVDKVKKRGRPPKAGPSRRLQNKEQTIIKMYNGKLANFVKFRSHNQSDSDFDYY